MVKVTFAILSAVKVDVCNWYRRYKSYLVTVNNFSLDNLSLE
jgi:hypothetical protein